MKSLTPIRGSSGDAPFEAYPHFEEADSYDIGASVQTLLHAALSHWRLILVSVCLTLAVVIAYMSLWPPTFQAQVVVMANADDDNQRAAFYQPWNVFRRDPLSDEALLMTSGPVLEKVVDQLDLRYEEVYHPFMRYAVHLWGESWIGRNYRRVKYAIFPQPTSAFAPSEELIERAKVLKDFRDSVSLVQVGDANIGLLLVKGSTQRVAEVANAIIDMYLIERRERFVEEASAAHESLATETARARGQLLQTEAQLREFYADNGLLLAFEKDRVQLNQWMNLRGEITSLEARQAELRETLRTVRSQLAAESSEIRNVQILMDDVRGLQRSLTEFEVSRELALEKYQPTAPEVLSIDQQIRAVQGIISEKIAILAEQETKGPNDMYESLRTQIAGLETELAGVDASVESRRASAAEMENVLEQLPEKMQMNHELERERLLVESEYQALNERLTMAAVSMATARSAPAAMRVVEYATPPEKQSWPNTKLLLGAAAIFGLMCGLIGALVIDLIFIRANRYRFWRNPSEYEVYGLVRQDTEFVDRLYA